MFYSVYHCLLAIASKFGYDSRNQECTFALIQSLIEQNKIDFGEGWLEKITSLEVEPDNQNTIVNIRESYQYGTRLSMEDKTYNEIFEFAIEVLAKTKVIVEG